MTEDEYIAHDAIGLAELVRLAAVTPLELLELALARIARLNPEVNAVVHSMERDARADATRLPSGVFGGVPFLAKDLISNYRGHPTSGASRLLRDHPMPLDSEMAARVRATGVSILGKTNLPEWGLQPVSESELWGPCRNPWDPGRTPGGSSGGSAAAVASGMVPIAGGGDGGGSIRIPASCCGLFGLKPTRARTPTGPDRGQLWRGASVEHVLTRSVRDSAAMLDATRGPDVGAPFHIPPPERPFLEEIDVPPGRLRIAWSTEPTVPAQVHQDCRDAVADAVHLLAELGHDLTEAGPRVDGDRFAKAFVTTVSAELSADLVDAARIVGRKVRRRDVESATWALGLLGRAISATEYALALRTLELVGRDVGTFFESYDVLLTPTLSRPPVPIGSLGPTPREKKLLALLGRFGSGRLVKAAGLLDEAAEGALDFTPWTPIYNATGQPAMSVPLYWSEEGLPIGVHLVGRFGAEATLIRLASQLERTRPWFDRLPPMARNTA